MATSSKKSSKSSSKKTSKYAGLKGDALKRKFFSQSPVGAQGLTVEQRVQGASVNRTKMQTEVTLTVSQVNLFQMEKAVILSKNFKVELFQQIQWELLHQQYLLFNNKIWDLQV